MSQGFSGAPWIGGGLKENPQESHHVRLGRGGPSNKTQTIVGGGFTCSGVAFTQRKPASLGGPTLKITGPVASVQV